MQNLWGGEGPVMHFYSQACPSLYELDKGVAAASLTPLGNEGRMEPYLVGYGAGSLPHLPLFPAQGKEFGYVLSGRLELVVGNSEYAAEAGEATHLRTKMPSQWKNTESETARMLWLKIN